MDPKESTTPADDPNAANTPAATDPTGTESTKTGGDANNLDPSKSTDTPAADDDTSKDQPKGDDKKDDTPASTLDTDLDDWITKRGLKVPETPEEKQALQNLRNEQREFTRERQAKKEAEELAQAKADAKTDIPDDEDDDELDDDQKRLKKVEDELASERTTRLQSEFYQSSKVTPEEHKAILDIMKEKFAAPSTPEGKKRALDTWSSVDALPDLLDLARARVMKASQSTVADEAARKERERIERESNAKSPGANASTTHTQDKTEDQARLERFKARYNKS